MPCEGRPPQQNYPPENAITVVDCVDSLGNAEGLQVQQGHLRHIQTPVPEIGRTERQNRFPTLTLALNRIQHRALSRVLDLAFQTCAVEAEFSSRFLGPYLKGTLLVRSERTLVDQVFRGPETATASGHQIVAPLSRPHERFILDRPGAKPSSRFHVWRSQAEHLRCRSVRAIVTFGLDKDDFGRWTVLPAGGSLRRPPALDKFRQKSCLARWRSPWRPE